MASQQESDSSAPEAEAPAAAAPVAGSPKAGSPMADSPPADAPKRGADGSGSCENDGRTAAAGSGAKAAQALSPAGKDKGLIAAAKEDAGKGKGLIAAAKKDAKNNASGGGAKAALTQKATKTDTVPSEPPLKAGLHRPNIYVRIRPLADTGGHSEDGTVLTKHLDTWDESSVTMETQYLFSKGEAKYTYPKHVFGTEASQQEVTDAMVPELVNSFTEERTSVLFFAYGQTGTGKTRTMLGTEPSLQSSTPHEDWGVFPRVCAATFEKVAQLQAHGKRCVLIGSAIEFYLGECFDLLASSKRTGNAPVQIDWESHTPSGESCVVLEQPSDLMSFLALVIANRTARSTNFNQASSEHSGSSRSHAALILTLMQLDVQSREYCKTTFTLVDLAGAERPDKVADQVPKKAGGKELANLTPEMLPSVLEGRDSGALTQKKLDAMIPLNFQTKVINFELFLLGSEVLKASEAHRKRKPYLAPKKMVTPTIKFLSAIFDGQARLAMCVTLSPAGRNAWETWFSLQYGSDLAGLHAPLRKEKVHDVDKLHKALSKEAATKAKDLEGMAKDHRYYATKTHLAAVAAEQLRRLNMLIGEGAG